MNLEYKLDEKGRFLVDLKARRELGIKKHQWMQVNLKNNRNNNEVVHDIGKLNSNGMFSLTKNVRDYLSLENTGELEIKPYDGSSIDLLFKIGDEKSRFPVPQKYREYHSIAPGKLIRVVYEQQLYSITRIDRRNRLLVPPHIMNELQLKKDDYFFATIKRII